MATKKSTKTSEKQGVPQAPLVVNAQYVKDLSFENPNPLDHAKSNDAPEIAVNIDVRATPIQDKTFEVVLHINADAKKSEKSLFVAEVAYAGVFTVGDGVPKESVHPVLMIECPRLLFPYARSILSDVTREGGYPPLSLNPIDFVELYRNQYQNQENPEGTSKEPAKGGS